jgi:hypothetical protein
MDLEDLSRMSEAELREKADEQLDPPVKVQGAFQFTVKPDLSAAQFFIDEIERRAGEAERKRQSWITTRDLLLEVVVIVLIGAEIYFGIMGGNQQLDALRKLNINAGQQYQLLQTMNKNAEQTAKALTDLTQEQQTAVATQQQTLQMVTEMNSSLRTELGLNFKPALTLIPEPSTKRLAFQNVGKTNLFIWGSKVEGAPPEVLPEPRIVAATTTYLLDVTALWAIESAALTKGNTDRKRLELNLKAADQKKYVASFFLVFAWQEDKLTMNVQVTGIEQKDW